MFVFAQLEKITAVRKWGVTAKLSQSQRTDAKKKRRKHIFLETEEQAWCLAAIGGMSRSCCSRQHSGFVLSCSWCDGFRISK